MSTYDQSNFWHWHESNFTRRTQAITPENEFENYAINITAIASMGQGVNASLGLESIVH